MKKCITVALSFLAFPVMAQFAPAVGKPGTTAMFKDSSSFISWATHCKVIRGLQDISDASLGYATVGDSTAAVGKADGITVLSLGDGGIAILEFAKPITNGEGFDFAVFENSFNDTFLELAFVEVSSDGATYTRFPATSNTQDAVQIDNGISGEAGATQLNNLAGKYRGTYGTPFDLQELSGVSGLDINHITHVKIIDVVGSIQPAYATYDKNGKKINDPWTTAFPSGGFDLDGVGVIHQGSTAAVATVVSPINFNVYPLPITATSHINVSAKEPMRVKIDVLDLTGRVVATIADHLSIEHEKNIPVGELNLKGVYLLRIGTGNSSISKKIIFK